MSKPVVLRILLSPAPRTKVWTAAIAEACRLAQWDYFESWGGPLPKLKAGRNTVVVGWSYDRDVPGAHWSVLACDPQSAVVYLRQHHDLSEAELLYHVAGRFAIMSKLAIEGALVWRDDSEAIDFPFLGQVRTVDGAYTPPAVSGPLSFYEAIPPLAGATAEWPVGYFNYPGVAAPTDATMTLELTGRRRLLFNGPNFSLPPGLWTARARFDLDPKWATVDLLMEWGHGEHVQALRQALTTPGRYELKLSHLWEVAAPGDFRVSIMMPVLDGTLTFHGVTVECEGADQSRL
ncbi:hypothetical protein D3C72_378900 [compost metagenome]